METISFAFLEVIARSMRKPLVIDGRNIYDAEEMKEVGVEYFCIGQ